MEEEKRKLIDLYSLLKNATNKEKIIEKIRKDNFLQKLYWDDESGFFSFLKKELSVSPRELTDFVVRYITPITGYIPCIFCGKREENLFEFFNHDQYRQVESFYNSGEYYCIIQGKEYDFRCPACKRRRIDFLEEHEKYLESETEEERSNRIQFLRDLSYKDYSSYRNTTHWKLVRSLKPQDICEKCGRRKRDKRLDLHHKTYEHLGEEENYLKDLEVFCSSCHAEVHGRREEDGN